MKDKMMICPKAKDGSCDPFKVLPYKYRYHCTAHEHRQGCDGRVPFTCPACIPYEPQPATCPDSCADCDGDGCFHAELKAIHDMPYADLQPEKCGGLHAPYHDLCPVCDKDLAEYWKKPTPTMPLISSAADSVEVMFKMQQQRDADMAWHTLEADRLYKEAFEKGKYIGEATQAARDSTIRREFAEKVIHNLHLMGIERAEFIENIRAMAEEKE